MFAKDVTAGQMFTIPMSPRQERMGIKSPVMRAEVIRYVEGQGDCTIEYSVPGSGFVTGGTLILKGLSTINPV